jgi:SNF2 family DNA or RNA helicase
MFKPVPSRSKLLVNPAVFKKVNHRLFTDKKLITHREKRWVVLPHDDVVHSIFRRHELDIPGPIRFYYNWPGRWKPFSHQLGTAEYMTAFERGWVANDLGTGKTMAALWAADYLMSKGMHKSILIVAPLSTLERVWGDALFENFYHRTFKVIHGSKDKRLKLLNEPADFYIINHDGIKIPEIKALLKERTDISMA